MIEIGKSAFTRCVGRTFLSAETPGRQECLPLAHALTSPLRYLLAGLFLLLVEAPALSQDESPPEQPGIPVVGRPSADFYHAAGTGVRLKAEATPKSLTTNDWLIYTLTISKVLNPQDVQKPSLKALSDFDVSFQIDEAPNLDPPFDPKHNEQRVFKYRLRPQSTTINLIPQIAFYYFDPRRVALPGQPQLRFPKALSNAVPIQVKPPAAPPPAEPTPLSVPAFAERLAPLAGPLHLATDDSGIRLELIVVLVCSPLVALAYVLLWRQQFPDAAKLQRLRRNRAVRVALTRLAAIPEQDADEFAHGIQAVLLQYLHERFNLPVHQVTATEVVSYLRSIAASATAIERVETHLRQCEMIRFGQSRNQEVNLRSLTEQAIIALEEGA